MSYAVVITSEGATQSGSGCEGWDVEVDDTPRGDTQQIFDSEIREKARFCDGDDAYWLVGVSGENVKDGCGQDMLDNSVITNCLQYRVYYEMLQGWDILNGEEENW